MTESMIQNQRYTSTHDENEIKSKYKLEFEHHLSEYPEIHKSRILPWQLFTRDFTAEDLPVDDDVRKIMIANMEEKIDFRPYFNDNPLTVTTTDCMQKCCELFRKMHLRHLTVIDPNTGEVIGMITRQDLFTWLDL